MVPTEGLVEGTVGSEKQKTTIFWSDFQPHKSIGRMSRLILLSPVPGGCEQLRVQAPLSY